MMTEESVKDCFASALKEENKGKKHKGLLLTKPNIKEAEEYIIKAKKNLELCKFYKEKGFDYINSCRHQQRNGKTQAKEPSIYLRE